MLTPQESKDSENKTIPKYLIKSKPGFRKKINWQKYSKTLKQFDPNKYKKINRICTLLAVVSFGELIASTLLYCLIMPWWLASIIAYATWVILTEYNLNTMYVLYILIFRNNNLMLDMIDDHKRWSA